MDYINNFSNFVKVDLADFYNAMKPVYSKWTNGSTDDPLSYFYAHWPRFEAMIKLLQENTSGEFDKMCELGSFFPYTSFAFKSDSSTIDLYDIAQRESTMLTYDINGVKLHNFNLNIDSFDDEKYDLIIISEVMEHLPCNLIELQTRVMSMLAPGGILFATYPCGGYAPAGDYNKILGDVNVLCHPHLREFTEETSKTFFTSLKEVASTMINYPAYGLMRLAVYKND